MGGDKIVLLDGAGANGGGAATNGLLSMIRIWKQPEIKDIFEKCGAKKPDKATWGDVQYVFAMYYSDGFPKVFKCENELVKATLMYLDDPDAPEGVAFIRWLAVQDYLGEKINWKDLT